MTDVRLGPPRPPTGIMLMWTVYDRPSDFPAHVVVRGAYIMAGNPDPLPRKDVHVFPDIEAARAWLMQDPNLYRQPRHWNDVPQIVEVWF